MVYNETLRLKLACLPRPFLDADERKLHHQFARWLKAKPRTQQKERLRFNTQDMGVAVTTLCFCRAGRRRTSHFCLHSELSTGLIISL